MYCLDKCYNAEKLPDINLSFVQVLISVLAPPTKKATKSTDEKREIRESLTKFHQNVYSKIMHEKTLLSYCNFGHAIDYEATRIVTALNNHISQHFEDMFVQSFRKYHVGCETP